MNSSERCTCTCGNVSDDTVISPRRVWRWCSAHFLEWFWTIWWSLSPLVAMILLLIQFIESTSWCRRRRRSVHRCLRCTRLTQFARSLISARRLAMRYSPFSFLEIRLFWQEVKCLSTCTCRPHPQPNHSARRIIIPYSFQPPLMKYDVVVCCVLLLLCMLCSDWWCRLLV